jgi:2-polyprenyl-6-methoxyphenol hydroxylase-like FAD-dependent oxidoreductase
VTWAPDRRPRHSSDAPVIAVGAGPIGLVRALLLAQARGDADRVAALMVEAGRDL